jgi:hypothetical protein
VKILPGRRFRQPFAERVDRQRRLRKLFLRKSHAAFDDGHAERSNREARSRSVEGAGAFDWVGTTALRLARG